MTSINQFQILDRTTCVYSSMFVQFKPERYKGSKLPASEGLKVAEGADRHTGGELAL